MRAEFVNPFVRAAAEVLESELGNPPTRGAVGVAKSPYCTQEVVALIGVTGQVAGTVLYAMSRATACAIVSRILGQPFHELDGLAQSGIGELGNVITGRAAMLLAEAGFPAELTPPLVLTGAGAHLNSLEVPRLTISLETEVGPIELHVGLEEHAAGARRVAAARPMPARA
jgi:chemotaxis protein CheX